MAKNEDKISRVIRSKSAAQANYDRLSRWYDLLAESSEKKFRQLGLQKLRAGDGERILEIGFGTGHGLLALAQGVGRSGRVYGLDLSLGMLNLSRARLKEAQLLARVPLTWGDGTNLPFAANYFDAIFLSFTLELFDTPEIPAVLQECQRVLRDKGRICVVALSRKGGVGIMIWFYEWAHRQFPRLVDCRPIFARRALAAARFQRIAATEMSMWGLPVEIVLAEKRG